MSCGACYGPVAVCTDYGAAGKFHSHCDILGEASEVSVEKLDDYDGTCDHKSRYPISVTGKKLRGESGLSLMEWGEMGMKQTNQAWSGDGFWMAIKIAKIVTTWQLTSRIGRWQIENLADLPILGLVSKYTSVCMRRTKLIPHLSKYRTFTFWPLTTSTFKRFTVAPSRLHTCRKRTLLKRHNRLEVECLVRLLD